MDEQDIKEAKEAVDNVFALMLAASLERKRFNEASKLANAAIAEAKDAFEAKASEARRTADEASVAARSEYEALAMAETEKLKAFEDRAKAAELARDTARTAVEGKYGLGLLPTVGAASGGRVRL